MTHDEKINYMRISAGIAGFGISNEHLDLLVSIYELVLEKKGESTVDDATKIEIEVKKRANVRLKNELLDKVSTKVKT